MRLLLLLALTLTLTLSAEPPRPTFGSIERLDPALDKLIAPDAQIEVLASGFNWSEGPVWDKEHNRLLFSDVPENKIFQWNEQDGLSVYMTPSGFTGLGDYGRERGSNGLDFDKQGRLLCCEHGDRRVSVLTKGGGKRTLTDNFDGKRFNSPNDLAVHSNGSIYFTDPPYGLPERENDPTREIDIFGVYRIAPDGKVSVVDATLDRPNGIALSHDEKTAYVAQSHGPAPIIKKYNIQPDGSFDKGTTLFNCKDLKGPGAPDGLKLDQRGNVWSTGPGGVLIISPDGKLLGRILTGHRTANCAWGDDGSTLYMTADFYLCRIRTNAKAAGW